MKTEAENVKTHKKDPVQGIHVVAKPIGPVCNLNCEYCFYLEKQALFGAGEKFGCPMKSCCLHHKLHRIPAYPVVEFVWQGGEPALLGIDFSKE